ncbi:hypothetical protein J437_LFUL017703 [Ladona fulva]|uniref:C2H2-type domain-containing protein n=1 Tax=Ladona fulva TaxID=123851 RepID=A0A8K0KN06_LADFU|nr:hypothetical protein J437_LFUL017703 [Ladona fulva]
MGLLGCGVGDVAGVIGASSGSALSAGAAKKQRPKKYRCPHCQVAFSNNGQLRGHIRIHTGERPFHCEYEGCGKAFTRNEELTRHRRIHSGQRPFACPLCDKRFGRKDHLKKHARTHAPPPSAHQYFLQPHSDPRFLLAPPAGGVFAPSQSYLLGGADPAGHPHSQRMMEIAALSGFPYLYGY